MKKTKKPIPKKLLALNILNSSTGITAREFAKAFWPEHPGWKRVKNGGNGAVRGKGMWLLGGSYLRKLENKGLVRTEYNGTAPRFYTTQAGRKELEKLKNYK